MEAVIPKEVKKNVYVGIPNFFFTSSEVMTRFVTSTGLFDQPGKINKR